MPSDEISEWMAYDLTTNQEWLDNYNREVEMENQKKMTNENKKRLFKQIIGDR